MEFVSWDDNLPNFSWKVIQNSNGSSHHQLSHYYYINHHFPMVFPWFSHGFPMVFPTTKAPTSHRLATSIPSHDFSHGIAPRSMARASVSRGPCKDWRLGPSCQVQGERLPSGKLSHNYGKIIIFNGKIHYKW